jgi:hypothetical protein
VPLGAAGPGGAPLASSCVAAAAEALDLVPSSAPGCGGGSSSGRGIPTAPQLCQLLGRARRLPHAVAPRHATYVTVRPMRSRARYRPVATPSAGRGQQPGPRRPCGPGYEEGAPALERVHGRPLVLPSQQPAAPAALLVHGWLAAFDCSTNPLPHCPFVSDFFSLLSRVPRGAGGSCRATNPNTVLFQQCP